MRNLTVRQQQVAERLVTGARDKEIAAELGLAALTVKEYVGQLMCVYGAKNRTHVAVLFDREHRVT